MTSKEILLEQMDACYNQKNWFVPVTGALEGLTEQQAKWHEGDNHSIWQIVNHLIFWNERWLERFKGEVPPKMEGSNDSTFDGENGNYEQWDQAAGKLFNILDQWKNELTGADNTRLEGEAFKDFGDSWYSVLTQVTIHNAYHIGQIVYIRKQQGSWNPEQGVK
jgi:uncharacterized damage-inducible protein DinB